MSEEIALLQQTYERETITLRSITTAYPLVAVEISVKSVERTSVMITFRQTPSDRAMLEKLTRMRGLSRSEVIRAAIRQSFNRELHRLEKGRHDRLEPLGRKWHRRV